MNNLNLLYDFDKKFGKKIVGVDEAGRGPWAGPVVAAAVMLDFSRLNYYKEINDSKKISEQKREKLFDLITNTCKSYAIAEISHSIIDEKNILQATMDAMKNAIEKIKDAYDIILIDGIQKPDIAFANVECIKGGDAKSLSIAAASIIAKVYRDRIMRYYDKIYPEYKFAKNKGYGTDEHIKALTEIGICPIHRKSYKPIIKILKKNNAE